MRNVNLINEYEDIYTETSFILTMRNVNINVEFAKGVKFNGFILTMRNVNGIERCSRDFVELMFYLNYEECKYVL
ncbi:MAG: hypothetical protein ACRCYH_09270 [Clostridium chrysemydis]